MFRAKKTEGYARGPRKEEDSGLSEGSDSKPRSSWTAPQGDWKKEKLAKAWTSVESATQTGERANRPLSRDLSLRTKATVVLPKPRGQSRSVGTSVEQPVGLAHAKMKVKPWVWTFENKKPMAVEGVWTRPVRSEDTSPSALQGREVRPARPRAVHFFQTPGPVEQFATPKRATGKMTQDISEEGNEALKKKVIFEVNIGMMKEEMKDETKEGARGEMEQKIHAQSCEETKESKKDVRKEVHKTGNGEADGLNEKTEKGKEEISEEAKGPIEETMKKREEIGEDAQEENHEYKLKVIKQEEGKTVKKDSEVETQEISMDVTKKRVEEDGTTEIDEEATSGNTDWMDGLWIPKQPGTHVFAAGAAEPATEQLSEDEMPTAETFLQEQQGTQGSLPETGTEDFPETPMKQESFGGTASSSASLDEGPFPYGHCCVPQSGVGMAADTSDSDDLVTFVVQGALSQAVTEMDKEGKRGVSGHLQP